MKKKKKDRKRECVETGQGQENMRQQDIKSRHQSKARNAETNTDTQYTRENTGRAHVDASMAVSPLSIC